MSQRKIPGAPKGLGTKARKLWRETLAQYALRADELRILEDACREFDLVDRLQADLDREDSPLMVRGSQGQTVINPIISEIRQHRAQGARLLHQLKLPDVEAGEETSSEAVANARTAAARTAAQSRWMVAHGKGS